jgi:hypothetical protein
VRYISPDPAWMSGKDALDFIRKADTGCSAADAIDQLRRAIVNRAVGATISTRAVGARLKDMKPVPVPMGSSPMQPHSASLPSPAMWQRAKIRSDGSVQFDLKGPWLPFEVIRSHVLRIWGGQRAPPSYPRQREKARPIDDGIREALSALCPPRTHPPLKAKERNQKIVEWLKAQGYSIPRGGGLARAVQRAMKPRG